MLTYDKLQRGFANKQTTRTLRFSWCFAVKKGAKTFPRKLEDACQLRRQIQIQTETMESELPNFSLNLDFGHFENETPNKRVKKKSEEDLDKSVEDQKSINTSRSTQFALRTWQTWLEQSEFCAEFGYGKYIIVPFCYASAAYQARLVSPWVFWLDCVSPKYEPWLDQIRLICRRSVPKRYD